MASIHPLHDSAGECLAPHFVDEKTEVGRGDVSCPRSLVLLRADPGFYERENDSEAPLSSLGPAAPRQRCGLFIRLSYLQVYFE